MPTFRNETSGQQEEAIRGVSAHWTGVWGECPGGTASGVFGESNLFGVRGNSNSGHGVRGESNLAAGVSGRGPTGGFFEGGSGAAVHAAALATGPAGRFEGDVEVTGDIRLVNADCAEDFDISGGKEIEPGTVTVLNQEGALQQSQEAYDKRVAGVVSGAGGYRPGITLDKQQSQDNRIPVALLGKVYCKVDAKYSPVEVGDLLTTSSTPGHAMKAADPLKAFGAVLGKALRPLKEGQGLIPILVALQ
jgi:hypothetical protein